MFQTHQTLLQRISFKLLIQRTTQVGTLPLMIYPALSYDKVSVFFAFHLNIKSLQYQFDKLQTFLLDCPTDFQILGISEPRLKTDISKTTNIQILGFNIERIPTKSANGGPLLYIRNTINYKRRPGLNVEKEKELESIFIEILKKTSKNIITDCIYRYPYMHPNHPKFLNRKTCQRKEQRTQMLVQQNFLI